MSLIQDLMWNSISDFLRNASTLQQFKKGYLDWSARRPLKATQCFKDRRLFLENFVDCVYCPPPFRRKAEGHGFWLSIRLSFRPPIGVCTLCKQLLLQFYSNSFETLQMSFYHALKMCMWFGYNPQINF